MGMLNRVVSEGTKRLGGKGGAGRSTGGRSTGGRRSAGRKPAAGRSSKAGGLGSLKRYLPK